MDEIQKLVEEYNATEAQQAARLKELFYILKARQGFRAITFDDGGSMLTNCWDMPSARLDDEYYLNKYNRKISKVEEGTL